MKKCHNGHVDRLLVAASATSLLPSTSEVRIFSQPECCSEYSHIHTRGSCNSALTGQITILVL